jgi:hypothetical protein
MVKRSADQVLDAIDAWEEDDAIDAEMERVLASTPEQREAELRAAGLDVEAERAKAAESREKAFAPGAAPAAGAALAPIVPLRPAPRRRVLRMAVLLAAVLGLFLVVVRLPKQPPDTSPPPAHRAQELRNQAFADCDAQRWDQCLRELNAARELDPAGEQDARVRQYRERAEHAAAGR